MLAPYHFYQAWQRESSFIERNIGLFYDHEISLKRPSSPFPTDLSLKEDFENSGFYPQLNLLNVSWDTVYFPVMRKSYNVKEIRILFSYSCFTVSLESRSEISPWCYREANEIRSDFLVSCKDRSRSTPQVVFIVPFPPDSLELHLLSNNHPLKANTVSLTFCNFLPTRLALNLELAHPVLLFFHYLKPRDWARDVCFHLYCFSRFRSLTCVLSNKNSSHREQVTGVLPCRFLERECIFGVAVGSAAPFSVFWTH